MDTSFECPSSRTVEADNVETPAMQFEIDLGRKYTSSKRTWNPIYEFNPFSDITNQQTQGPSEKRIRRTYNQGETLYEEIEKFALSICTAPIINFTKSNLYLDSCYKWKTGPSNTIKIVMENLKMQFVHWKLHDYYNFYKTYPFIKQPSWQAYNTHNFNNLYIERKRSTNLLKVFLAYQYGDLLVGDDGFYEEQYIDMDVVVEIVRFMVRFFNQENGKKNTWYIIGPPNCGKSLFTDLIQDYFLNTGNMGNWNKYCNFPLQMCKNVRLVFWNEPNFTSDKAEDLLKLLGGDRLSFDVKNQNHDIIATIPIIITANTYVFSSHEKWTSRIQYDTWKQAAFLKNFIGKRIHPLALQDLIIECENVIKEYLISKKVNKVIV